MKTDVIRITSSGEQMELALKQADKVAVYKELSVKNATHLRLLAEEMMGMMRSIAGEIEGTFWIEDEDGVFQLHLQAETLLNAQKREKLISAASSGKNEAARGFMGKLRAFFEPDEDDLPLFFSPITADGPDGINDVTWSMFTYREQLEQYMEEKRAGAAEAWDELEKSVISHMADDVKVNIRARKVDLTIVKKLS